MVLRTVITRAAKREGSPTVPSRFLQRIRAFAGEAAWEAALGAGRRFAGYARALDTAAAQPRLTQPKPKPDPALFPRSLSVTEIETLVRDPYAIFARHVLGLDPLEAVAEPFVQMMLLLTEATMLIKKQVLFSWIIYLCTKILVVQK